MENDTFEPITSKGQLLVILFTAFIFAGIGILLVFNVFAAGTDTNIDLFLVTDPSVDRVCTLSDEPTNTNIDVEYYDGTGWSDVAASDYTLAGSTVTVDADVFD